MSTGNNDSKNILNSDVELKGTIRFTSELTFDGNLEGDVQSEGTLHLGDNAVVKGNIAANTVVVRGKINGNVTAKDKIDIKTRTELFGDVRASRLVMEEGVIFVGRTEVNPNKVSPTPQPAGEAPKPTPGAKPGGF
jgi:cytoskeletal protein CcmA (bactofilin family)